MVERASRETGENTAFLPGVTLDDAIRRHQPNSADLGACDLILAVAPAQHLRSRADRLRRRTPGPALPVVLCAKGVEQGSLKLMTEVLAETLPQAAPAVLSGPSFAGEVARGLPTAVTLACGDEACADRIAQRHRHPDLPPLPRHRHDRRRGRRGGEERAGHRLRHRRGPGPGPQRPRRPDHPRLRRD